jgi:hypothetical protein
MMGEIRRERTQGLNVILPRGSFRSLRTATWLSSSVVEIAIKRREGAGDERAIQKLTKINLIKEKTGWLGYGKSHLLNLLQKFERSIYFL